MSDRDARGAPPPGDASVALATPDGVPRIALTPPGEALPELDRLRRLHALALSLGGSLDRRELVPTILAEATAATAAAGGSLWIADGGDVVCEHATGHEAARLKGVRVPLERILRDEGPEVLAVRLVAGEETVGALRLTHTAGGAFTEADRAVAVGIADVAAIALRNAERYRQADRGRDLALVLEMSREVTGTLDLDRVFRTVVNLAIRVLTFDRGAVALYENGACEIRAVAGADRVDPDDPALRDFAERGAWAAGVGESFYLADRTEPGSDAERIMLQVYGPDLERNGVGSGLYVPLKDEEGVVGILLFEAERPNFADERQRELIAILANQVTVAVRNAQLYSAVPLADTLRAFTERRQALFALPRQRRLAWGLGALAVLAALTLIRWPLRVVGSAPVFRPLGRTEVRALTDGIVERVLVREGSPVRRGDAVAQLRDTEIRAERDAAISASTAAEREATIAATRGDAGQEQLQRSRAATFRREAALLDEQLVATTVRSPVSGIVFTPRPEERLGAQLDAGDAIVLVGRTDTLDLEFEVDQRDVGRVSPGEAVRLRVDALPQRTFEGRVTWVADIASNAEPGAAPDAPASFRVRAAVPNPDGLLRPGMRVYARVLTAPASLAGRVLREPARRARLLWWRMWS